MAQTNQEGTNTDIAGAKLASEEDAAQWIQNNNFDNGFHGIGLWNWPDGGNIAPSGNLFYNNTIKDAKGLAIGCKWISYWLQHLSKSISKPKISYSYMVQWLFLQIASIGTTQNK